MNHPANSKQTARRVGQCALCQYSRQELCKSHIQPEFTYRAMYDNRHKALAVSPLNPSQFKKFQQGLKQYLLCTECEGFLAREYETPFKEFWYGSSIQPVVLGDTSADAVKLLRIPDPRRFVLFHLSVLWRAGVSTLHQYDEVQLGNRHEERLRVLVHQEVNLDLDEYPIWAYVAAQPGDGQPWTDIILPPHRVRLEGVSAYEFTFAGCSWYYGVSSHKTHLIRQIALNDEGLLPLVRRPIPSMVKHYIPAWTAQGIQQKN